MRLIIVLFCCICFSQNTFSQNPIHWSWSAQKISDKEYEVKLTATIDEGWHLYSQKQSNEAIAIPTEFVFNKNPRVEHKDEVTEERELEKYRDETMDIEAWQYSNKVVVVQNLKLKAKVKTTQLGSVEYQACTDE